MTEEWGKQPQDVFIFSQMIHTANTKLGKKLVTKNENNTETWNTTDINPEKSRTQLEGRITKETSKRHD